jgi:O-antigen/teichoic acid export membrane protein
MQNSTADGAEAEHAKRGFRQLGPLLATGLLAALVGGSANFIMHALLGRMLGAADYGIFSLVLGVATVLAQVPGLGVQIGVTRFIATYRARANLRRLAGSIAWSFAVTACGSVLICVGCLLAAYALADGKSSQLVIFAGLLTPLIAFRILFRRQLMGLGHDRMAMFWDEGAIPCAMLLVLLFLFGFEPSGNSPGDGSLFEVLTAFAAAATVVVLLQAAHVAHAVPRGAWRASRQYRVRPWLFLGLPLLVGLLSRTALNRLDVIVVAPIESVDAVGHYSAALRLAYAILFVPLLTGSLFTSRIAAAYHTGEHATVRQLFWLACGVSLVASAPLLIAFTLYAEPLMLAAFGPQFVAAAPVLGWFALGNGTIAATAGLTPLMAMTGRHKQYGYSTLTAALLAVAVGFPATVMFGATGAAAAYALSVVLMQGWQFILVARYLVPGDSGGGNSGDAN